MIQVTRPGQASAQRTGGRDAADAAPPGDPGPGRASTARCPPTTWPASSACRSRRSAGTCAGCSDEGLLDRVYGGATRPAGRSSEGSFAARSGPEHRGQAGHRGAGRLAGRARGDRSSSTSAPPRWRWPGRCPPSFRGRVLTNSVPAADGTVRPRGDRDAAVRRAGPARRRAPAPARTPRRSSPSSTPTGRSSAPAACTPRPGSPTTTRPRWWCGAPSSRTPPPPTCWPTPASSASSPCTGSARSTASRRSSPTTRATPSAYQALSSAGVTLLRASAAGTEAATGLHQPPLPAAGDGDDRLAREASR